MILETKRRLRNLTIEITGKCNLQCAHCAQRRLKQSGIWGDIMPPDLFSRILDHLIKIGMIDGPGTRDVPFHVILYSWGEPLLHPKINEILRILRDKKFKAGVSSNLVHLPHIERELFPVIGNLTLSLSGFTQDSYGRIHGQSLQKVIDNFEKIYADLRKHSPDTVIKISWHRYIFNEDEFWAAHKYFNRPGITIEPLVAFLNDGIQMVDFLQDRLSAEHLAELKGNIDLEWMQMRGNYHRKKSKEYRCKQWDHLVIDEYGRLLTCCSFTGYDPGAALGDILEMSTDEIWDKKDKSSLCARCVSSGAARFIHKLDASLPPGGGIYGWKQRTGILKEIIRRKFTVDYFRRKLSKLLPL